MKSELTVLKMKSLRSFLRILPLAGLGLQPLTAADVTFNNTAGDSTWENASNWDTGTVATGSDTITIPAGFNVTRASLLRLTNEGPGTLDIEEGASLTISGDLQLDQAPASVNIAGSLIFAAGGTKSNMDNGPTQGTYSLSGLLRFEDYENGIASAGNANGAPLLDFVQVGASMEALGMDAADFTNLDGKLVPPAFFFAINGTQVNTTGTPAGPSGAEVVDGLYLARTDTADSVTLTLTEASGPWISLPTGITVANNGAVESVQVQVENVHPTTSLNITDISVTGLDAGLFTITSATPLAVAPGGVSTISLSFDPGATLGAIDAVLEVESDNFGVPGSVSIAPINGTVRDPWISTPENIDLGSVVIGSDPVPFSVSVSNIGASRNLTGFGAFLTGPDAPFFAVVTDFEQVLAPNGEAEVELTFDPSGTRGTYTATLELDSNDAEEPIRYIDLVVEVIHDPVIAVPEYVVAGPYVVGGAGPRSFTVPVENLGAGENLTLSPAPSFVEGDAAFFSLSGHDGSISPGGAGEITIDFNPPVDTRANYRTTLRIESNDPLTPTVDLEIYANVVEPAPSGLLLHHPFEEGVDATTEDVISGMALATDSATWLTPSGGLAESTAALDFSFATNPATWVDDTPGGFVGIAGNADRTVTAWIRTTDAGRNAVIAWGSSFGTAGGGLGQRSSFLVNSGALRFEIGGGFAIGTANIADGNWHHIAISTTGTDTANTVFWVDGVVDPTAGFGNANPIDSIARWVSVGGESQPGGGTTRFQGEIDDLRVYDRVLTGPEIAALMNPGGGGPGLAIAGYDSGTGLLNLTASNIPEGQTFHLKQSVDLQNWGLLSPSFDFTSSTPQPFGIPVNPAAVPALFFQVFDGPSNP